MNLIQQLKDNEKSFGLMSAEMQEKAKSMDIADFEFYTSECEWKPYPSGDFYYAQACRLRPDYEEQQEIEEYAIDYNRTSNYQYYIRENERCISDACDDPDFIGFKFEDGIIGNHSVLYQHNMSQLEVTQYDSLKTGASKVLHATHALFRRQE